MVEEELTAATPSLLLIGIEKYRSEYPAVYFTQVKQEPYQDENGVWRCIMRRSESCD
jgi:hypothetical protein